MFDESSKLNFLQRKEVNKYYLLSTKRKPNNNKIYKNKIKVIIIRIISLLLLILFAFFILSKILKKPKKKEIKQIEQTEQIIQIEQTEQIKQIEQTEQIKQIEQTEQIKQIEQTEQIKPKLRIGVIGVYHEINVGNNLVKYSISIILKQLGFIPYIVGTHYYDFDISFLQKRTNLIVLKNSFNEIKRDDFDILMVNSDQTWRKLDNNFLDYGFLKFAKDWNIKKFAYGPSLGHDYWAISPENTMIAKELLKNFTGISIREKNSIDLVKEHFGVTPEFVLDPTLLIDKQYYLDLIQNYTKNKITEENYIFVYQVVRDINLENYIYKTSRQLNYKVYEFKLKKKFLLKILFIIYQIVKQY